MNQTLGLALWTVALVFFCAVIAITIRDNVRRAYPDDSSQTSRSH